MFFCFYVVRSLEKEDFLENSHVLSCIVQLKSVLFSLLCVLDFFFFSERWQSALFQIYFFFKVRKVINLSFLSKSFQLSKSFKRNMFTAPSQLAEVFTILTLTDTKFNQLAIHRTRSSQNTIFFFFSRTKPPSTFEVKDCKFLRSLKTFFSPNYRSQSDTKPSPLSKSVKKKKKNLLHTLEGNRVSEEPAEFKTRSAPFRVKRCHSCTRGGRRKCSTARERSHRCRRRR